MTNKKSMVFSLSLSLFLILSSLIFVACSKESADVVKEDVIKRVLELQFNDPDKKFMALIHDPKYTTVIDNQEVNPELDQYIQEVYGPYFMESYLETFLNTIGLKYPVIAYTSGYKLNLKDVVVEKSKKASNRYDFTATVGYQKEGEIEKTTELSGYTLFSTNDKGKIGKFEYDNDNGFSEELNN